MFVRRRLPALLAFLLLGALSLRLGLSFLVALPLTLALLVLLFNPRSVVQAILGGVLWVGVLAWAGTAYLRVSERLALGLPWLRLVVIFAAVALFTAWAAWLLRLGKSESPTADDAEGRR